MTDDTRADKAKPISRRLRFEIIRRDGNKCTYCGARADDVALTVDHVIPRALGGSDEPSNLATACQPCNAGKGSTSPDERVVDGVDERAQRWADALERAAEQRRQTWAQSRQIVKAFDDVWNSWKAGERLIPRDLDWDKSIDTFVAAGFNAQDLDHFITVAMRSKATLDGKWKYFCGCVWREIGERQKAAMAWVDSPRESMQGDSESEVEQRIAEAVAAARWSHYDEGYADGLHTGRFGNEDASVAYEDGFRSGSDRVLEKWKRECPDFWMTRPPEDGPVELDRILIDFVLTSLYAEPDSEWVD